MQLIVIRKKYIISLSLICILGIAISIICSILYSSHMNSIKNTSKNNSYLILVYIEEKKLYLFQNNQCIKEYPIASGKPGWPSPIGQWKIVEKGNWGKGFGGRWLGLNVPWGKYGIHGTSQESSIGRAVSHGCIRLYNKDIKELYKIVPLGTVVVIREGLYGPFGAGFRELIPGDRGADVLAVQQRLRELGFFKGKITGIYEDNLKYALYHFQEEENLKKKHTITKEDYHAMGFREFE